MTTFLHDGGPFFMYPILLILIGILFLLAFSFTKKSDHSKNIQMIHNLAIFVVAWGFTGQIIGLMVAFEAIEMAGNISPKLMSAGLRISFHPPLFGLITFLIAKLGVIILQWVKK